MKDIRDDILTEEQWRSSIVKTLTNLQLQIDNQQKQILTISKALDFICAEILRIKEGTNEKNN